MDFYYEEPKVQAIAIDDLDIVDLVKTLKSQGAVLHVPGLTDEMIDKGQVLYGFTDGQLVTAIMRYNARKKAVPKFIEYILGSNSNVVITPGKVVAYVDDDEKTYLMAEGMFMAENTEAERREASVVAVVGAVLAVNPVVLEKTVKKFVKADATGEVYPPVDVFTAASNISRHYLEKGDENLVPRTLRAAIAQKVMKNDNAATFYRDVLAKTISPDNSTGKAGFAMTNIYRKIPAEENSGTVKYQTSLGQNYLGGERVRCLAPKFKEMPKSSDPLKNVWLTHEKYRQKNGGDSGFISNFTNSYYLGELGPDYELAVPLAMDILEFMNVGKYEVVAKFTDKKLNRVWPILDCNVLVHDETAYPYEQVMSKEGQLIWPATGTYNFRELSKFKLMKLSNGGMIVAPNVAAKSVKYTGLDEADNEIKKLLVSSTFTHVLTYAYPDLWECNEFYISPTRLAHANMVWVNMCVGGETSNYNLQAHCNRTIFALQWKAYFPFHRRIFAVVDQVSFVSVRLLRKGKLLPVSYDDMVECAFVVDEEAILKREVGPVFCEKMPEIRKNVFPANELFRKMNAEEMAAAAMARIQASKQKQQQVEVIEEAGEDEEVKVEVLPPQDEYDPDIV